MLVGRFNLSDLVNVLEADGAHDVMSRSAGAFLYARSFLEEVSGGWSFRNEGERAIRLNKNLGGNGNAGLNMRGASVELLAEVH